MHVDSPAIDRRTLMPTSRARDLETVEGRRKLSALLAAARQEFIADIRRGNGGTAAHARFATRVDELIRQIVGIARAHTPTPVAIAALGGYGRRTLCLHSDIDLLIVFDGRIGRPEERFVKGILHPLWDLRLTVGHQVRVLRDFDETERDNPEFLLALLDARLLAGEPAVFKPAEARFRGSGVECREQVLKALLQLMEQRHLQFNDTIYQLEPDVKDSPGGLRDIVASRLLASLAERPTALNPIDRDHLDYAEDFLLRIRSVLHLEAGRNLNVLTHDLQEKAADTLRFEGAQPQQRVEALMGEYFRHARHVSRTLERTRRLAGPAGRDTTRVALGLNLELTADGIGFADMQRAASEPASWLHAFEAALERGVPVSDESLDLFERNAAAYRPTDILPTPADRQRLLTFLHPRPGLYAGLSQMLDCGLLPRLFPEFGAISCRVIRDFYHKYTVDEHTLLTIRGIERLISPDQPSRERFSSILSELHTPELLVLALLFHDVGKWKDDDHAEESVRMARSMLDRLDVTPDGRQDVEFLIAQHLLMSRAAFRRDSDDPAVVRQFATIVGTEERLKMLCLMTLVDIEAVSTETLTAWREELLWRLYVDTYNQLTLGYGDEMIRPEQDAVAALQATRPPDVGDAELARFLEGFPQRYLTMFDAEHIYRHARLSRDIHPDEVHLFLEQKDDVWELTVVTLDKPYLFSNICGVLSYFGMDILRGSAMTSPEGLVLDIFQFTDHEGFFRFNPSATPQFENLLKDVVAGRQDVTSLLQRKESGVLNRRGPRRITPVVYFDNEHSQRYTVLEIVAQDALGLLYRISRVISRHGCDVDLVLISTEGNKAIDVFHLTKAAAKLSEPAQMALKEDLERMLEEGYATH
jgi:[protein-PII] uridylyltransferase